MGSMKKHFFNNNNIPAKFSIFYLLSGIFGIISLDKLIKVFFEYNDVTEQGPLAFGLLFILSTGLILFIILNHMQKVIKRIDDSYNDLKEKDKPGLCNRKSA